MAGRRLFICPRFSPFSFFTAQSLHERHFGSLTGSMRGGCKKLLPKAAFPIASRSLILGIETSCDDTGACVMSLQGEVLGEALSTQLSARYLELWIFIGENWDLIIGMAVLYPLLPWPGTRRKSRELWHWLWKKQKWDSNIWRQLQWPIGQDLKDLSLWGPIMQSRCNAQLCSMKWMNPRYLCMKHNLPMLPVHHMAAHALTARMERTDLKFPFLV